MDVSGADTREPKEAAGHGMKSAFPVRRILYPSVDRGTRRHPPDSQELAGEGVLHLYESSGTCVHQNKSGQHLSCVRAQVYISPHNNPSSNSIDQEMETLKE